MTERIPMTDASAPSFLEFFCGAGLVRLGLGPDWRCLFANDVDAKKCAAYRLNFGSDGLLEADVATLSADDLPRERARLAWASFPCQDLSLAGARAGLGGARSGLFFEFIRLMRGLKASARLPSAIVVENVVGLLTSRGGADFRAVVGELVALGYVASAIIVDARSFVPQSRPRLFILGFGAEAAPPLAPGPGADAPPALLRAVAGFAPEAAARWRWLAPRPPLRAPLALADVIDWDDPAWSEAAGQRALAMMSPRQREDALQRLAGGAPCIGAAFRRIRIEAGERAQRLEARFDGLAGCLRTPAGGSSRQMLLRIAEGTVAARLMRAREAARVMGAPDRWRLPARETDALRALGDGVAPPVARWIAEEILLPALAGARRAA